MSDQPTGEWTYVPGAANPGRWSFGKIVCGKVTICEHIEGELYGRQIADAHNAALAEATDAAVQEMLLVKQQLDAERRAAEVEINEGVAARDINHLNRIDELERQLAAEREEVRVMTNQCVQLRQELVAERQKHRKEMEAVTMNTSDIETVQQLRDQLAAEREKRENSDRKWIVATGQLRQQLADALADREKLQPLVDALNKLLVTPASQRDAIIRDALAKVAK